MPIVNDAGETIDNIRNDIDAGKIRSHPRLHELRTVENEATRFGFTERRIEQRLEAIRELKNRQEEKQTSAPKLKPAEP